MKSGRTIFLFLSTGRCGTQWLATNLRELYPDRAEVTHEPLGPRYEPRRFFRAYRSLDEMGAHPPIGAHLAWIEDTTRTRDYVETGWPLFSAVPLFLERFKGRVGIVHLTRHPVPTSISHMVHQCYGGSPRNDDYTRLAALDPFCPRVFQPEAERSWEDLTPYEKCLFWWTEVNLYAEEIQGRYPDVPFHRIKSEDLLRGNEDVLQALFAALGLPYTDEARARTRHPIDRWKHQTRLEFDWRKIFAHPRAVAVAERLGYVVSEVDDSRLDQRYKGPPHEEAAS